MIRLPVIWKKSYIYDIQINPGNNDDENSFYTFDIEPLYAKLLYAEDRACSNRGLNSCGFYIEGFRCDHGDFASHIEIEKELLYDKHTLEDTYLYKDTTREFQWEKMKERLSLLESIQKEPSQWAILQNYKNRNGEAPLVKVFKRDAYKRVSDTLGVERYQSVPLCC